MHFVNPKLLRNSGCYRSGIACQHDGSGNAGAMEGINGLFGCGFDYIGDDDVAGICAVNCNMHNCAGQMAVKMADAERGHQLAVAGGDLLSVYHSGDAVAADFHHVFHPVRIQNR